MNWDINFEPDHITQYLCLTSLMLLYIEFQIGENTNMHVSLHSGKTVWASTYFWSCTVISNDIKFRSEWADLAKTFSIRLDSLLTSCVSFWRFASTGSWVAVGEPSERAEIKKRKDERTQILEKSRCFYAYGRKISRIRVQPKRHSKSLKISDHAVIKLSFSICFEPNVSGWKQWTGDESWMSG